MRNIYLDSNNNNNNNALSGAESFVIFGQRHNFPSSTLYLGSRENNGYYAEITSKNYNQGEAGGTFTRDSLSRTSTLIGDINKDGYEDFMEGFPLDSICFVYLGNANGFDNMVVSFAIYGNSNIDGLGWAVTGLTDINQDQIDDFLVVGRTSGIGYVIYGKTSFKTGKNLYLSSFTEDDGFRIIGYSAMVNGLSVANAGDFNKDGYNDIVISAFASSSSKSFLYIIFGVPHQIRQDVYLQQLNSSTGFTMISASFSFAGMSVSGVGDINADGYDDIIIGSIPLQRGQFLLQQESYVIYGRSNVGHQNKNTSSQLLLSEMTMDDGFMIVGGGFYVVGPGDLNHDGINDLFIVNYNGWEGLGNAYLFVYPTMNLTSSPTYEPSSVPTSSPSNRPTIPPSIFVPPTSEPTNWPTKFQRLSSRPTFMNETSVPTFSITKRPSMKPSIMPTKTIKPSKIPSKVPTLLPTTTIPTQQNFAFKTAKPSLTPIRTINPSKSPISSFPPTMNTTSMGNIITTNRPANFTITQCQNGGNYYGSANQNQEFIISGDGIFNIQARPATSVSLVTSNEDQEIKTYQILPGNNFITITAFVAGRDVIDLSHFPQFQSMKGLTYSQPPVQLQLSSEQVLLLSAVDVFTSLTERNFIFTTTDDSNNNNYQLASFSLNNDEIKDLLIICGIFAFGMIVIRLGLFCKIREENKENEKIEKATNDEALKDSLQMSKQLLNGSCQNSHKLDIEQGRKKEFESSLFSTLSSLSQHEQAGHEQSNDISSSASMFNTDDDDDDDDEEEYSRHQAHAIEIGSWSLSSRSTIIYFGEKEFS